MSRYSMRCLNVLRGLLAGYPQVREGRMFGYPAFFVGKRMFACVYGDGVGIKLPAAEVVQLLSCAWVIPFQPHGKHKMREWVQINRAHPEDYLKDIALFEKSLMFVNGFQSESKK